MSNWRSVKYEMNMEMYSYLMHDLSMKVFPVCLKNRSMCFKSGVNLSKFIMHPGGHFASGWYWVNDGQDWPRISPTLNVCCNQFITMKVTVLKCMTRHVKSILLPQSCKTMISAICWSLLAYYSARFQDYMYIVCSKRKMCTCAFFTFEQETIQISHLNLQHHIY